jgi:hypothetical protein
MTCLTRLTRLIPLSLLALGACAPSIEYVATNRPAHALAPRPPESVEVYTASVPDRPFQEIGLIEIQQARAFATGDSPGEQIWALRVEAGRRGCEAVILTGPNDALVGYSSRTAAVGREGAVVTASSHQETLKGYRATCIIYRDAA